jgi:hypothetical protein
MTAVLLLAAGTALGGGKDTYREVFSLPEDPGEKEETPWSGPVTGWRPFIFVTSSGAAGTIRGLNLLCPLGSAPFRFQLIGGLGLRPGAGKLEAGGGLTVSYDF